MNLPRRSLLLAPALAAQNARPLRVGVIGLGNRSRAHLDALMKLARDASVTALCDLDSARIDRANSSHAAAYTDYRELLADLNVDAVVIVAPNFLHQEMALAALRAGKDVLVEKPLALTYAGAREVAAEAARRGRILAVGMQRRYTAADTRIRELVAGGRIGAVHFISYSEYRGDWNPASWKFNGTNWRFLRETAGSSELELGIHSFGFIQSLIGSPLARLTATGGSVHFKGRETRDLSAAIADFSNGARLQYSYCGFTSRAWRTCSIAGGEGALEVQASRLLIHAGGKLEVEELPARQAESPETGMYRDFFQSVRARKPSVLHPEFAIEASKIAYAMDLAIRENRAVTAVDFSRPDKI